MFEGAASADWATSAFPCEPIITSSAPPMTQRCPGQESNLHARKRGMVSQTTVYPIPPPGRVEPEQKVPRTGIEPAMPLKATWSEHAVYPVPPPRRRSKIGSRAGRVRPIRELSFIDRHDRIRTCVVSAPNGVPASTRLRAGRLLRVGSNHLVLPHEGSCSPTSRSNDVFARSRTRISSFGDSRVFLFTTKTGHPRQESNLHPLGS